MLALKGCSPQVLHGLQHYLLHSQGA